MPALCVLSLKCPALYNSRVFAAKLCVLLGKREPASRRRSKCVPLSFKPQDQLAGCRSLWHTVSFYTVLYPALPLNRQLLHFNVKLASPLCIVTPQASQEKGV